MGTKDSTIGSASNLVTVDVTGVPGTVVVIGNTSVEVEGVAFDALAAVLYGVTRDSLYTLDVTTGAASAVGTGLGAHDDVFGLTRDPIRQTLLGTDNGFNTGEVPEIVSIDPLTGNSTTLRPINRGVTWPFGPQIDHSRCNYARGAAFVF